MIVTSHLPIQTTNIFQFFDMHLYHPTLKKVPTPMEACTFLFHQSTMRIIHCV